ncbi:hypothetical protein LAUMK4_05870 [Mycobacterium persicum]|uniref:Uncharacterized protein n=1 Tax=Mycobacterium persicum TaxID=1487726 RepID=A0ABY6RSL1_9MYCO|nr:hypothetical protein [Mycobacterium persicum]VAZ77508.1 hypothetical protein LAUMK15_03875 [Mycobacterium persicum]VBA33089.1 hypothetical protein LAUMK4_05870 [Mycobacterium persicum]
MSYPVKPGPYGFIWGPMNVTRVAEHRGYVALDITTATGKSITVYVSPTGRSLRVFADGGEMKPEGR